MAIIEWEPGQKDDLLLVRFDREGADEPVRVSSEEQLWGEACLWCFRPDELPRAWHNAWQTLADQGRALDAGELARILLPMNAAHDHAALARHFGMTAEWSDCKTRAESVGVVARELLNVLYAQPLAVLLEMEKLLKPRFHPLREVIAPVVKDAVKKGFGAKQRELTDLFPKEGTGFGRKGRKAKEPPALLDAARLCGAFMPDGRLAKSHSRYEYRPEQVRMVQEVCEAFNEGLALMVEAGTGTGKSLAYLVPAIAWAVANDDPVIISTNTKNLQGQLCGNDLPFLEQTATGKFRYALIKGRANYLCLRRFQSVIQGADRELSESNRLEILPVLTWLGQTETGDVAENAGFAPGIESELWSLISTQRDECVGPRCRWRRRCFIQRTRARAQRADIVVANHATVFWDGGGKSTALPAHRCIVFDEAHNLEDVATDCLAIVVTPWQVPRTLRRLYQGRRDGTGRGLFASLRFHLSKAAHLVSIDAAKQIGKRIEEAIERFDAVRRAGKKLFVEVERLFVDSRQSWSDRIRYDADHRPENWPEVAHAIGDYSAVIEKVAAAVDAIAKMTLEISEDGGEDRELQDLLEAGVEVGAQAMQLREQIQALQIVLQADDEARVYWAERGRERAGSSLSAAPLNIAEVMNEVIYSKSRAVVLTSATLTTGGSFDFMRDRLGLRGPVSERVRTAALGSSFDFENQALAGVPVFLPEPRRHGPDFVAPFTKLAVRTLRAVHGGGLVLFTSHSMLRQAAEVFKRELAGDGIRVLAQGMDGGREALLRVFGADTSSVLLGTQSFWEGVDVPGESLTCLIVAKLPFRPHTDPMVSARCELLENLGRNAFMEYMVPDAVIRLKQGFGRLIRSRKDRGVVLICDPRVVTKHYGRAFRDSLPAAVQAFSSEDALLEALREFMAR